MSDALRILDTGLRPARWNVAMTAALAELHADGRTPDTVRLHRYPACVLLGRGQAVEAAADVDHCNRQGIDIARRVTGGGAVFMSPRMLAWDAVVDRRTCGGSLEAITRAICSGIADALARLGAAARFRAPNDIAIGGRKVSGSSGYLLARSAMLQGTVIAEDCATAMARALRIPEPALRDTLTSLEGALGAAPAPGAVAACIARGIAEALGREAVPGTLSTAETACCEALLQAEIGTDAFVRGAAA